MMAEKQLLRLKEEEYTQQLTHGTAKMAQPEAAQTQTERAKEGTTRPAPHG